MKRTKMMLGLFSLMCTGSEAYAIKQEMGIGAFGGWNREHASVKIGHIVSGGRFHFDIGNIFRAGADGKFLFTKQNSHIIQTRVFFNLLFGRGKTQPYLGAAGSYNILKTTGAADLRKFGVGGHAGVGVRFFERVIFFTEAQFDYVLTPTVKTKVYGGIGGLMFQF